MANFKTHLTGGFAVSGVLGLITYKAGLVDAQQFLMCVLAGTVGGLLPDIDSDNSTPIKMGFDFVSLATAFALVIHWRSELSLVSMILLWLAGYGFVRYGVFAIFTRLTVHRGIIHSVPYMLVLALGLTCLNFYIFDIPAIISWFYGSFLLLGSLVHLGLDEAYSVDLLNRRLKRSSGTAMKFYQDSQRYYYLGLYTILLIFIFISPPFEPFFEKLTDPITWWVLKDEILPQVLMRNI
ncbi:metal-dependent hydrolase [Psychrobacter raelei]|uniref:Metal-dependent hydrolase n=1 Tax=Psychrobacter raelei TaxID=2565531 RepID=A0AAT9PET1_9GAMM|nr:metal-dependent hydrolase [Psychrobacter sp. PraFG1]UNK05285.1 metal-dependent hydrolase [Psychrobacter sp. PraFG1]